MVAGGTAPGARRPRATLFVLSCAAAGLAPHWLPPDQRLWPALALTLLLGLYAARTVFLPLFRSGRSSEAATVTISPPATGPASIWWSRPAMRRR